MEQRTYNDQNDIRPIEELLSGGKRAPEAYHTGYHYPENMQSGVQQVQQSYAGQEAAPDYASPAPNQFSEAPTGLGQYPGEMARDAHMQEHASDGPQVFIAESALDEEPLHLTTESQTHHKTSKRKTHKPSKFKAPILWAALGFACGVAFWNMVGFWGFVEDAVLQSPEQTQLSSSILRRQNSMSPETHVRTRATRPMMIYNHVACTSLVKGQRRGATVPARCEKGKAFYRGKRQLRTSARLDY